MTIADFSPHFARTLVATAKKQRLETAATEIAAFFAVTPHEVAFFQVDSRGRSAVFRWPPQAGSTMNIPLKSYGSSLVSATAREERGFINNAFVTTPHLHMFEHVLAEPQQRIPVQKIMSARVSVDGVLRGIIQVCRKGRNRDEAGADFSNDDLLHLEQIAEILARFDL
ncbi:MAG: hypothetical protein A2091_05915 [Desulfuromonadales bacterium GWD2_61_12]|nr:MAG: hypothetical protein A2091_05915 [Desulfuromonadales bacterium GWD2_61_12]HAD03469.1 hypothetical protein [Desulfuromonas sp.]HBT82590.1 hypothetical protein [Desulfuromonas sp.]